MQRRLTVGSLFAGIGGFDLAAERAGLEVRWQVEIDPFCRAVLEKHWPRLHRPSDVRKVHPYGGQDSGPCAECVWAVDFIVGGFPCQDLSPAGKRAGMDGERSGLWRQFVRVVQELKPRGVVIENVHHAWRQWVPVLRRSLWQLGYASLPIRVRASDFGAWHERSRVYLVAHVDPSALRLESWRRRWPFREETPLFAYASEGGPRGAWVERFAESRREPVATDVDAVRQLQPEGSQRDERGWSSDGYRWPPEPDVVRVVHGVPSRLHGRRMAARIGGLGNAVIPVIPEWIFRCLVEAETTSERRGATW
jgi:DNA (cytosine-5)-methyltransferase 1